MFSDLTARVAKAMQCATIDHILSEIVTHFHFFRFSLFEFAEKHMIIQTKKYLKVRPKRHNSRQLKLAKSHEILSRKVSQTKRGEVPACCTRMCLQRSAVVRTEHE